VNEYARQHGNRLPVAAHINPLKIPMKKSCSRSAAGDIRSVIQKTGSASAISAAE
jgi:hypothetical protein